MFRNIIFDWSGVIKDAVVHLDWVVNRMFQDFGGGQMTIREIRENWEQPYMKFWNKYFPELKLEEEQKIYYKAISDKDCPKAGAYPGIVDFIKRLKSKGVSMVILSSDPPETLFPEMEQFGLENIFDEAVVKIHDKSEEIEGLIMRNNFKKEETVFIGDSNHEIEVGKQAGIKTVAVTWGFGTEEKLKAKGPDYLVHNIKELEDALLN